MLTDDELAQWQRNGCLVVDDVLPLEQVERLSDWAGVVEHWVPRASEAKPLVRRVADGRVVAIENVADQHDHLGRLLRTGPLPAIAEVLLGEHVVLHSEIVHYERLGDPAHQLAARAKYIDRHLGCLIAIDPIEQATVEVSMGCHRRLLPADRHGRLEPIATSDLVWQSFELRVGSTLWLHRWTPHRATAPITPGASDRRQRYLDVTYSARVQGDLRAAFYAIRRREAQATIDGRSDGGDGSATGRGKV